MDLTHHFTVPTSVDETWAHFQDIASVGECFPGATVTDVTDDAFKGTVKVKLGPIAMVYSGTGTFVEKDDSAHSFVVDAKGKDKRGNGTAGAKVHLSMSEAAGGAGTDVEVITDLAVTGKPAQFGRGVMQDVSDKLLGQFVSCLEQRLGESSQATSPDDAPQAATTAPVAAPAAAGSAEGAEGGGNDDAGGAAPAAGPQSVSAPAAADPAAAPENGSGRHAAPTAAGAASTPQQRPTPAPAKNDDALDLGATVLPILIKSYWKQGAIALVVLLVIIYLIVHFV